MQVIRAVGEVWTPGSGWTSGSRVVGLVITIRGVALAVSLVTRCDHPEVEDSDSIW